MLHLLSNINGSPAIRSVFEEMGMRLNNLLSFWTGFEDFKYLFVYNQCGCTHFKADLNRSHMCVRMHCPLKATTVCSSCMIVVWHFYRSTVHCCESLQIRPLHEILEGYHKTKALFKHTWKSKNKDSLSVFLSGSHILRAIHLIYIKQLFYYGLIQLIHKK